MTLRAIASFLAIAAICVAQTFQLRQMSAQIEGLGKPAPAAEVPPGNAGPPGPAKPEEEPPEIHTAAELEKLIRELDEKASIETLARNLTVCCSWIFRVGDEQRAADLRESMITRLREQVRKEVLALQRKAIEAPTWKEGCAIQAKAGQILALYPLSRDPAVVEESRSLSLAQSEVLTRLDVLRKQRYCLWATTKIEAAIDGYHQNEDWFHPLAENRALIESLIRNLGEVDPTLLEQVTHDLYMHAIQLTKDSISEAEGVELGKRLLDPKNNRKTLGSF